MYNNKNICNSLNLNFVLYRDCSSISFFNSSNRITNLKTIYCLIVIAFDPLILFVLWGILIKKIYNPISVIYIAKTRPILPSIDSFSSQIYITLLNANHEQFSLDNFKRSKLTKSYLIGALSPRAKCTYATCAYLHISFAQRKKTVNNTRHWLDRSDHVVLFSF